MAASRGNRSTRGIARVPARLDRKAAQAIATLRLLEIIDGHARWARRELEQAFRPAGHERSHGQKHSITSSVSSHLR
jgi:hypothetical protein